MSAFRLHPTASLLVAALAALASPALAADEIHWTVMGQTAITVDWRGSETTVRYGTTTSYGQTVTALTPTPLPFSSAGPFWEARVTGLAENTLYHYSIGTGADHTFRTPPPRGASNFSIYVEGDIGDAATYANVAKVQTVIAGDLPRFVLMVGDLTYGNAHGQAVVDRHYNDVMVWSTDAAYMPAWGNHEWDVPSADDLRNYKGRLDLPNQQTSPGSPSVSCCGEDWYWFDYGNVRFIAYPEPWSGALSDWNTKAKALMDQAQADPSITFIVTYGHRPAYSSGHHPGLTELKNDLDALGASHSKYQLDLCGHSHNYERTIPLSGVTHVTVGCGGSSFEQDGTCLWYGGCPPPSWTAFRAFRHSPLRVTFTPNSMVCAAICGPTDPKQDNNCTAGTIMDGWTILSGTGTVDNTPPSAPTNLRVRP